MAFSVVLCNCSDPPNKLSKDTTQGTSAPISCTPYEPMSDLTGYIIIDWSGDYEGCNYLTMTETWGDPQQTRTTYYFITDIVKEIGGKMRLVLKRDVLMTYKESIKQMKILATRSSVTGDGNVGYNSYLPDGLWACDATNLYYLSEDIMDGFFNYDHANAKYILMTAG